MNSGAVLLIWEECGEKLKFFMFDEGSSMARLCREAHGLFINASDNTEAQDKALEDLNERLEVTTPVYDSSIATTTYLPQQKIVEIFHAGFLP